MNGYNHKIEGFKIIMSRVAGNYDLQKLTHKEVRAYARCLLKIIPELTLDYKAKAEAEILLSAISVGGLAHYDRSFLARRILKILEENANSGASNSDNF